MKNLDLRKSAKAAGIPLWRIADAIGVGEATMTRKLRHELPEKEKQQMFGIIEQLAKEAETDDAEHGAHPICESTLSEDRGRRQDNRV